MKCVVFKGLLLVLAATSASRANDLPLVSWLQPAADDNSVLSPSDVELKPNQLPEPAKDATPENAIPETLKPGPTEAGTPSLQPATVEPHSNMPIASPSDYPAVEPGTATFQPASSGTHGLAGDVVYDNLGHYDHVPSYGRAGYGFNGRFNGHGGCGCASPCRLPVAGACNAFGAFGMHCLNFGDRCLSGLRPILMAPMSCGGGCNHGCGVAPCAPTCGCQPTCHSCGPVQGKPFGLGGLFGRGLFSAGRGCHAGCGEASCCDTDCASGHTGAANCGCGGHAASEASDYSSTPSDATSYSTVQPTPANVQHNVIPAPVQSGNDYEDIETLPRADQPGADELLTPDMGARIMQRRWSFLP